MAFGSHRTRSQAAKERVPASGNAFLFDSLKLCCQTNPMRHRVRRFGCEIGYDGQCAQTGFSRVPSSLSDVAREEIGQT